MWLSSTTITTCLCQKLRKTRGSPRQGVRDSIKRAEAQLLDMEDRLHLARRFRQMREGIAAIRQAAGEIQELNDRFGYSRDIEEKARQIAALSDQLAEA